MPDDPRIGGYLYVASAKAVERRLAEQQRVLIDALQRKLSREEIYNRIGEALDQNRLAREANNELIEIGERAKRKRLRRGRKEPDQ